MEVAYRDHLLNAVDHVSAKYLFLCAGSVNTTELLLRGVDGDRRTESDWHDAALGPGLTKSICELGKGYFVNADALAGIFDLERDAYPSAGPVITCALVYHGEKRGNAIGAFGLNAQLVPPKLPPVRKGVSPRSWFLIEDGGFPPAIARLLATFESPLALGRNRFDPDRLAPALLTAVRGLQASQPDRYQSIVDGLAAATAAGDLPDVLPKEFTKAATTLRQLAGSLRDAELKGLVAEIRDAVILNSKLFRFLKGCEVNTKCPKVWRWLYDVFVALTGVGDSELLATTLTATRQRYGTDDPKSVPERASHLLIREPYPINPSGSAFPPPPTGEPPPPEPPPRHQALLLAMGRDDMPADLALTADKRLVATFPEGGFPTLSEEERVMRGIADQLGGTLRSNPLWAFARRPVTVHSHGGCALGTVTDAWGEVAGYDNLFINDGSLLPTAVGVNPSSTIAAIAERNVRHFVIARLRRRLPDAWRRDIHAAKKWAAQQHAAKVALEPPTAAPIILNHKAIGFSFKEAMRGHVSELTPPDPCRLPPPGTTRIPLARFLRAEGDGRAAGVEVSFDLHAEVHDIGAFLNSLDHRMALTGMLNLGAGVVSPGPAAGIPIQDGTLSLLIDAAPDRRLMIYNMPFTYAGRQWTLLGQKEIQDDPGFDAWLDASTLYVEVVENRVETAHLLDAFGVGRPQTARGRGILSLGLHDFAQNQLRGLSAIGTDDPTRTIWTLGTFGLFFFGQMQGIYAPEIQSVLDMFSRSAWRTEKTTKRADSGPLNFLQGL